MCIPTSKIDRECRNEGKVLISKGYFGVIVSDAINRTPNYKADNQNFFLVITKNTGSLYFLVYSHVFYLCKGPCYRGSENVNGYPATNFGKDTFPFGMRKLQIL